LLKLSVDFGEFEEVKSQADETSEVQISKISKPRQIVSGISTYFPDPATLVGRTCMFVTNLEPRTIKGFESNGMLFAVSTPEGGFSLLEPNSSITPGTLAK
jgi:methionyl-tRNA synthetase